MKLTSFAREYRPVGGVRVYFKDFELSGVRKSNDIVRHKKYRRFELPLNRRDLRMRMYRGCVGLYRGGGTD